MWKWLKRVFPSEHEWAVQQLSAYLDSELSPPDRARVEAHLKECWTCAEELHTLRWTVNLTAQMPRLRAPRSFLITEAIAQPRRAPLSVVYVYLRGATIAVAALLLVVVASDFLLPYALPSRIPAPQMIKYKALPAVEEVSVEKEVIKEIPVETVVVEKEVVKEVQVEKEVEKPTPPMSPSPPEAKVAAELLVATPTPEEEAAKGMELEAEQVREEGTEQEPVILMAPPAKQPPGRDLGLEMGRAEAEQEKPVEKRAVIVTPSPTSARVAATPTPLAPHRTVEVEEVAPSPQPTPSPMAAAVAEATESAGLRFHPWRSSLRLMEMGLGLLMILLVGSTLFIRARHW